jgi:hypothetical protein
MKVKDVPNHHQFKRNAFFFGMLRAFDITGRLRSPWENEVVRGGSAKPRQKISDSESLKSDWLSIGQDFYKAINSFAMKHHQKK